MAYDHPQVVFATTTVFYCTTAPAERRRHHQAHPDRRRRPAVAFTSPRTTVITWRAAHRRHSVPRINGRTSIAVAMNTNAQRVYVITNARTVPLRRRRHDLAPDGLGRQTHSQRAGRVQLRRLRRSRESRHRLHVQHVASYKSTDGGNELHRIQRRARRRRPASRVDRSHQRPAHAPRLRPGRHRVARWRRDMELVVQSEHRAGVPHLGGQQLPVLGLRDATGRGRRAHAEPRRPGGDHSARLEPGERVGVGDDRPRPARPATRCMRAASG